jgi:HEPN domain-containing protein
MADEFVVRPSPSCPIGGILVVRMDRFEFQSLAAERLDDAVALLKAGRYACAYYVSGYAVECALKACIARQTKQDDFPPKDAARYYVHDIPKLLDIAGLGSAFKEASKDPTFRANWAVVKDWSEESRYQSRQQQQAQEMLDAVNDPQHGVLQWLKGNW